jgi:hypothetical protein
MFTLKIRRNEKKKKRLIGILWTFFHNFNTVETTTIFKMIQLSALYCQFF